MATINIENVVAKTTFGPGFDMARIAAKVEGVDYDPEKFPGFMWNPGGSKIAVLVLPNGRAISTGADSIAVAEESLNTLHGLLLDLGFISKASIEIKVENIVASFDLKTAVNLRAAKVSLSKMDPKYSPEEFPGLITKSGKPPQEVLLFESGKIISTGGRSIEAVSEVLLDIESSLRASGAIV